MEQQLTTDKIIGAGIKPFEDRIQNTCTHTTYPVGYRVTGLEYVYQLMLFVVCVCKRPRMVTCCMANVLFYGCM